MELLNRSFFRFAFAFMGMIAVSVVIILALGEADVGNAVAKPCEANCVEGQE